MVLSPCDQYTGTNRTDTKDQNYTLQLANDDNPNIMILP